ncbi:MAG: type II toxin-antitoxin system RelB/DinJ family antitoxin [Ruminococcaceae bacterium]|nr:type II toxin-antitoxin system RelB/DinJ family antitoxin [Oscillospiraceae bacterium]
MAKVSTNITIDADVKARAQELLTAMGMDLSTAVGVFLRQVVMERRIPFEIKAEVPNSLTKKEMAAAEKGEDMYGPFDTVEAFMEALNA